MIANIFDVNTTRGFSVTPKTAGMLSTANTTSLISIAIMQIKSGVAFLTPSTTEKNLSPSNLSVESITFRENFMIMLSLTSSPSSSSPRRIFKELYTSTPAKTSRIAWKFSIAAAPKPIMTALVTIAPKIPQFSTLSCASKGTPKKSKRRRKTNRLSTDKLCSRRYPAKNSSPVCEPTMVHKPAPNAPARKTQRRVLRIAC
mmetsp:Transcript_11232/g.19089  ORF Transcript_11232/g.19089 Transcript_11232/m.19089 type:complete len:201 (+) Transcript_11232:1134-1736(+)